MVHTPPLPPRWGKDSGGYARQRITAAWMGVNGETQAARDLQALRCHPHPTAPRRQVAKAWYPSPIEGEGGAS